jgi:hypothetical protein
VVTCHYHLTLLLIAKDVKWALKLAGAGLHHTAHSTRECSETCIIYGGRPSKQFTPDEAKQRARHSEQTQQLYYQRAVNPRWLSAIRGLRKGTTTICIQKNSYSNGNNSQNGLEL